MRTTLDIDDDVLAAAKQRAAEEKTTAGKVISDLVRQALTGPASVGSGEMRDGLIYEDGWYVRPSRGGLITSELIERIEGELDREDARPAGRERASGTDG